MLNTAFVGVGWWGTVLAESAAKFPDRIRICGAVSTDTDDLKRFNARFGGVGYSGFDQMLSDPDIQAVFLATPHSSHYDQICAAAASGKHVFVEKPMALTTADAQQAAQACKNAGVVLAVGHNRRFMAAATALKSILEGKELGFVLHAEAHFSADSAMHYQADEWRAQRHEAPGGSLASLGIHMIDTLTWLFGPITRVACLSKRKVLCVDIDDTTCALIEFDSGLTAYLGTLFATPLTKYSIFCKKTSELLILHRFSKHFTIFPLTATCPGNDFGPPPGAQGSPLGPLKDPLGPLKGHSCPTAARGGPRIYILKLVYSRSPPAGHVC